MTSKTASGSRILLETEKITILFCSGFQSSELLRLLCVIAELCSLLRITNPGSNSRDDYVDYCTAK